MKVLAPYAWRKLSPAAQLALCVGAGAFAVRLAWVLSAHVTQLSDFDDYHRLAVSWLKTGVLGNAGVAAYRTPGYPVFLAMIYAVVGASPKAAAVVQAALGGLSSGLIVLLAARIVPRPIAGLAGGIYALSPTSLAYTPILATENLAIPLSLAAFLLLFVAQHKRDLARIGVLFVSGCLLGLTILVRPAAGFFVPAWAALAIYRPSPRQWLPMGLAPAVIGLALVLGPWVSRNVGRGVGPVVSSVDGINLWMGNNDYATDGGYCFQARRCDQLTEREQEATYRRWAMHWIRSHPFRYLQLSAIRAFRLLGPTSDYWAALYLTPTRENDRANELTFVANETGAHLPQSVRDHSYRVVWRNAQFLQAWRWALTPFLLAGLLLSVVRWREYAIVLLPTLTYLLGISLTFAEVRFREMLDPFLFIPAAVALWHAGHFYFVRSRQLAAAPSTPAAPRAG